MRHPRLVPTLVLLVTVPLVAAAPLPQNPFAAKPAKEHALLEKLAGKWTAKFKLTMPGMPPMTSTGSEVNDLLGELWISSRYDDPAMMGGAFAGAQLLGYDPAKKKYVAAWADSQSATLSLQEGSYDEATRTLTLSGPSVDPMTGQQGTARSVLRWSDDDHRVQTMFVPSPGDEEMPLFEIEYARVK